MRRSAVAVVIAFVLLTAAGCSKPPVEHDLVIAFPRESGNATLTVDSRFELHPANDAMRGRVEAAQSAAASGTDEWSVRFARLNADSEEVTYRRRSQKLEAIRRSATIHARDLPLFFADMNATISLHRRDGLVELALYPGTSGRASRHDRQRFEEDLTTWSEAVSRYLTAIHHLYRYMDEHPHRAAVLFSALVANEENSELAVQAEEEQPLIDATIATMEKIALLVDDQGEQAMSLSERADLVLNPFPARVTFRLPADVVSSSGFTASPKGELVIEPVDLIAGLASLEGRWISPDPLAAILRDEVPSGATLAGMPRHSSATTSSAAIREAVLEAIALPEQYSIVWRE
jgi:hypothetical protein